jgi:hypothetical protein
MLFKQVVISTILAFSSGICAKQLPEDHIAWGRKGKPTSLVVKQKQVTSTSAQAIPASSVSVSSAIASATEVADGACQNGPYTRECWGSGFSIADDFDTKWPNTGVVRTYNFEITNSTCAPDGIPRPCCKLSIYILFIYQAYGLSQLSSMVNYQAQSLPLIGETLLK